MRLRSCVVILRLALLQFGGQRDRGRSPFRKTAMDAAEEDNAALADCIHLNDGVAGLGVLPAAQPSVYAIYFERVQQKFAVVTENAGVPDGQSGFCHGDGLIQPLAVDR